MRFHVALAAAAATLAIATPAFAQSVPVTDSAQAEAHGRVLSTHSLINSAPLDFGTVAPGTAADTVSVSAASLSIRTSGGAAGGLTLVPSAYGAARFDGRGAPGELIVLTLTPSTSGGLTLVDAASGASITGTLNIDSAGLSRNADASGNFTVYVGGDFNIGANQANGYYTGNFDLTAEYQ